ncbi:MAG: hypothetical protein KAS11_00605 [Candidatus Aenigmarchaeota archaeon]|nr:hypothetical protein [Candidatus Aenigmarchaeota archaeon]
MSDIAGNLGFDVLDGAKVLVVGGNRLDIEKKGRKDRVYIGTIDNRLYLSHFQTGSDVSGFIVPEDYKEKDNPFSWLVGQIVEVNHINYFSRKEREGKIPIFLNLKSSDDFGYQLATEDGEIKVFRYPFSE